MKKYIILAVIAVIVILCGTNGCSTYNKLVTSEQNVEQQWAQVQVQYQRRMDLIPNLMRTVQGYAQHESETFENVTRARAGLTEAMDAAANVAGSETLPTNAQDFAQLNGAQDALNRALNIYVNAVHEAYPTLQADTQFLNLQTQLEGTENRIATERGRYTEIVRDYNLIVRRFPGSIWASIFGFDTKPQFTAAAEAAQAPTVQF